MASGSLFVNRYTSGTILQIPSIGIVNTFAAGFSHPIGVAVDANQHIYVTERDTGSVWKYTAIPPVASINSGGVVNAASYTPGAPVAPGSIAGAFGSFPGSSASFAPGFPLPTVLSGLSFQFSNGSVAPLFFASGSQAGMQVPWELAGQTQASITAFGNGQVSAPQSVNLAPFAPGIFSMNSQGTGQGAILDTQYRLVDSSNPATAGDVIQIYCTALGAVTNQPPTGSPASSNPLSVTATNPTVTIGGAPAQLYFSGLAPGNVGLYQVNAQVPAGVTGGTAVPVAISMGDVASNTVTLAVQPFPISPNPKPSITSLSPSSVTVGTSSQPLTINGSGFIASSSVTLNGITHTPSFVNSGRLSINLNAADLNIPGSFPVMVTNPGPGGGTSNAALFTVTNPPLITGISPATPSASADVQTITVHGCNFESGLIVLDPVAPTGTVQGVTPTSFQWIIMLPSAGFPWSIRVENPDGSLSNIFNFTVGPTASKKTYNER